jgi:hypothetical protein
MSREKHLAQARAASSLLLSCHMDPGRHRPASNDARLHFSWSPRPQSRPTQELHANLLSVSASTEYTVVDTEFHGSLPPKNQLITHGKCSFYGRLHPS